MSLSDGKKTILKRIHQLQDPTTPTLKTDDTIRDHYSKGSIPKTLRRLVDDGYLDKEDGHPNSYALTPDGYTVVKAERNKEQRQYRLKPADELTVDDAKNIFENYFRIDEVEAQIIDAQLNDQSLTIDYAHLERFDAELADALLDNPTDLLDAASNALLRLAAVEQPMDVTLTNLPDYREKCIRELNTNDIGTIVTIPGVVLTASMIQGMLVHADFSCRSCGEIYSRAQDGGSPESPYKCSCGNKYFECVNEEYDDVRLLKLQEKPDSPDKNALLKMRYGSRISGF